MRKNLTNNKRALLVFAVIFSLALTYGNAAFAVHDTIVSVTPDLANCESIGKEYTVTVYNKDTSIDNVREVRIYRDVDGDGYADLGIEEFTCGDPPEGWTLDDRTALYHYCQYETTIIGGYMIEPDGTEIFTFNATLSDINEQCGNTFKVATIDDVVPEGQVKFKFPFISVDCSDPIIIKTVGEPKIPGDGFDYWVTSQTLINLSASDNVGQCDLGLDYCRWRIVLDGVPGTWNIEENGETLDWEFYLLLDSNHTIEVECYDIAGNLATLYEVDKVDNTPPVTTKVISEPKKIDGDVEWVDTVTTITLNAVDPEAETTPEGVDCSVGVDKTWYANVLAPCGEDACWNPTGESCTPQLTSPYEIEGQGKCIDLGQELCTESYPRGTAEWYNCVEGFAHGECGVRLEWHLYNGTPINKDEESCHILHFFSVDYLGNVEDMNVNCFFVDKTGPVVGKIHDKGMIEDYEDGIGIFHWTTSDMPITFTCTDPEPHPSGDEELCFKVSYDNADGQGGYGFITEKYCDHELEDGYCCVPATAQSPYIFYFNENEDSLHDLEYYCRDAVNKKSDIEIQYYKVDDTEPHLTDMSISDHYYAKYGDCPPDSWDDVCHVDGISEILYSVEDGGDICAVGEVWCQWGYYLDEGAFYGWYQDPIVFPEETQHDLVIECYDVLGNKMTDKRTFYVDHTAPKTTKTYGTPVFPEDGSYPKWITSSTEITLTATDDIGPHDSGVLATYYSVTVVGDEVCESVERCAEYNGPTESFVEYTGPFTMGQSCHLIEYYSVDNVGKVEETKRQCVYVDNTAPTLTKDNGEAIPGTGEDAFKTESNPDGNFHWITKNMPITITCEDQSPHPVGNENFCYKISYDYVETEPGVYEWGYITEDYCDEFEGDYDEVTGWCCVDMSAKEVGSVYQFYFMEDSMHNLEYFCEDALHNGGDIHMQYYKVDTVAPSVTKILNPPYYGQCPPGEGDDCYVDTATTIDLEIKDGGEICAIDQVTCKWRYNINGGDWSDWFTYSEQTPINFPEESYHELEIECWDKLGNTWTDTEYFIVDHSEPIIEKWYIGPEIYDNPEYHYPKWISAGTTIVINTYDPEPHPSGMKETLYRISVVDDMYCWDQQLCQGAEGTGDWESTGNGMFETSIPDESCHLIEIIATDNVEKQSTHKQCVFVDNTGPDTNKTVGEKKFTWDGSDAYYYPWIENFCWNGDPETQIDCWKVTTTTPITMSCEDPDPHPVGREHVCFRIELDGDVATSKYCSYYGGTYDETTEYCCVDGMIENFFFLEESEHNLEYYCVDALGNEGPVDEEKFKVHGETYEIELLKKWNLISVPFVLMDSSIEVVFGDIASDVISVWTYDNGVWFVWTPDDSDTDDLFDILPGVGYWVLMNNSATLTIGGSLLSEGPNGPPDNQLEPGWNLIGYYAATSMFNCGYLDGTTTNWYYSNPVYCSLNSLVDTQEGYPKWSALWTYYNYGTSSEWVGLNACCETSQWGITWCPNSMHAGQGYWVEIDVADLYSPATNCIWNEDFTCVWNY